MRGKVNGIDVAAADELFKSLSGNSGTDTCCELRCSGASDKRWP